jgi:hypothetical protein
MEQPATNNEHQLALEELKIIRRMMERTTARLTGSFAFWIVWGVGGFLAAAASEILVDTGHPEYVWIAWASYWPICLPLTLYFFRREFRLPHRPMSFIERMIGAVWTGMSAAFLLAAIAAVTVKAPEAATVAIMMTIAGTGVFITGALIEARIICAAGMLWWCGALVAIIWPHHFYLLEAALSLFAYLLPAYIVRIRAMRSDGIAPHAAESFA